MEDIVNGRLCPKIIAMDANFFLEAELFELAGWNFQYRYRFCIIVYGFILFEVVAMDDNAYGR